MIQLKPEDWRWATWRDYTPISRPSPRPFDQQGLCQRIRGHKHHWNWLHRELSHLPANITRQEALFWLTAVGEATTMKNYHLQEPRIVADRLATMTMDDAAVWEDVEALISGMNLHNLPPEIIIVLAELLPIEKLAEYLCNAYTQMPHGYYFYPKLIEGFYNYVTPYLTADERIRAREVIREPLANAQWTSGYYGTQPVYYLAAAIGGFSRELEAVIATIPNKAQTNMAYYAFGGLETIFGLDNAELVEQHTRRIGCHLFHPRHATAWLAHTETHALDWIQASIENSPNKQTAEKVFKVLALVEDEAVVPIMLELQRGSPVSMGAVKWLNAEHRDIAERGAAQVFLNGGKTSNIARDFLRGLKAKGHLAELQALYDTLDPAQQEKFKSEILDYVDDTPPALTAENTPGWLKDGITTVQTGKKFKMPVWLDITELPPIIIDGHSLNPEQGAAVLTALSRSTLEGPHPLVKALKQHVAAPVRDRFAWGLFELWQNRGGSSKEKWAMQALGLLGGDGVALQLAPYIRKWPGESQHQRAVVGLNCLRAIGSDTALMQINSIGQKAQYNAIKQAARKAIEAIAVERGMTKDQLDDRIIPDCGLDVDGRRVFDFGARKFTFALDSDLKPQIRDEAGKLKSDLPKPIKTDDTQLAEQGVLEWKLIKKQVREVAKVQSGRLEQALLGKRRWSQNEFENFIVNHPLMIHIARRLLWGGYSSDGKLKMTFRITDEKDFANSDDDPFTLGDVDCIGLAHPLHLSADDMAKWSEVFGDYEIIPPFPQLARKTYVLLPEERDTVEITRFAEIKIQALAMIGILQKLGWTRGTPMDGGMFSQHIKPFATENITAFIEYPGIPIGYYEGWEDQKIERCYFLRGIHNDVGYHDHKAEKIKLSEIDPVVISEVLRDLFVLTYRGEK
jgi:Domain of unknown function (DUF4132)